MWVEHLQITDTELIERLFAFEKTVENLSLVEKIRASQSLLETTSEENLLKILLLYVLGENEIKQEIERTIAWKDKNERAKLLISQLSSESDEIVLPTIALLGLLKEPVAIPYFRGILDAKNVSLCRAIATALERIGDADGMKLLTTLFSSSDAGLVAMATNILSDWKDEVNWKTFRPLLDHPDPGVRKEAVFAIAVRKKTASIGKIIRTIQKEKDADVHRTMIQHAGIIPSGKLIPFLLNIVAHDPDHKSKLNAARTLDRLQGIVPEKWLFRYRNSTDIDIRSDVLFRIGKFGTQSGTAKDYLRRTLVKTKDMRIRNACINAMGHISDHQDAALIMKYTLLDVITSYNAVMALIRIWRLEDKGYVIALLNSDLYATQKQILLKYLIRRNGLSLSPVMLLDCAQKILASTEDNINLRYLSLILLTYAPSTETIVYLLDSYMEARNEYEKEAVTSALHAMVLKSPNLAIDFLSGADSNHCFILLNVIPFGMDLVFYEELAKGLFKEYKPGGSGMTTSGYFCNNIFNFYLGNVLTARILLDHLPDNEWRKLVVEHLGKYDRSFIAALSDELTKMLSGADDDLKKGIVSLLDGITDMKLIPYLVDVFETTNFPTARNMVKKIVGVEVIDE